MDEVEDDKAEIVREGNDESTEGIAKAGNRTL